MDPQSTRFHRHLGRLAASAVPSWADCVARPASARGLTSVALGALMAGAIALPANAVRGCAGTSVESADSIDECLASTLADPRLSHASP